MTRLGRILVVDDEDEARTALADLLRGEHYEVETAADAFEALGICESFSPHVVVTDMQIPGIGGIEFIKRIRTIDDVISIIAMTELGDVDSALEAMRAGAAEYLITPVNGDELLVVLGKALDNQAVRREAHQLRERLRERMSPGNIVGISPPMQRVFEVVDQVAASRATVLISGESGTGKELVANAIHQRSQRANGPFIKLHCAVLAESLLESELFGHEKGALPSATARRDGRIQLADGGTLFLDEISEISPAIQVKLLRFLQDHELERVGGRQTIRVDVRVIAATNRPLLHEVAKGRFREDLYYRLNIVALEIPPLRERRSDIPALGKFFLDRYAAENARPVDGFTPEAMERLIGYDWPGNVRELENAIERSVVLARGPLIEPRHLPPNVRPRILPSGMPNVPGSTLRELERFAILETLKATGGSTSKAAEMLGISVRTIQYRLHQYNQGRSDVRKNGADSPGD
jgi:DNA-binding NtrC family response regulator